MATWRSTPPGKLASKGWLQGDPSPDPAVGGANLRHTARDSDFMLQCRGTPREPEEEEEEECRFADYLAERPMLEVMAPSQKYNTLLQTVLLTNPDP